MRISEAAVGRNSSSLRLVAGSSVFGLSFICDFSCCNQQAVENVSRSLDPVTLFIFDARTAEIVEFDAPGHQ
jgi:hypothetical protein